MTAQKAPKSYDPHKQGAFTFKGAKGRERVYPYPKRDMFAVQARHVVDAFGKGEQPLVTPQDGIEALKVASAVLRSGRSRRTVSP